MKRIVAAAVAVTASWLLAASSPAAPAANLQCFKIKDGLKSGPYTATLSPADTALLESTGCKIKLPAKTLCVPTSISNATPTPEGSSSATPAGAFLCYKTACPPQSPTWSGSDLFGDHEITVIKSGQFCAPIVTTTTSTTTTLPGCVSASDCPGMDSECQQRSCSMGVCGVSFVPAGTATMSQGIGDCKKNVCDGSGNVTIVNDDSDAPPLDPCAGSSCMDGTPQTDPLPMGTKFTDLDPGDCQVLACDGAGNTISEADDSDIQDDGNPCTTDSCSGGTPQHTLLPVGTSCGDNLYCDGQGLCGTCLAEVTCTDPLADCNRWICVENTCQVDNTYFEGTYLTDYTPGDCTATVCRSGIAVQEYYAPDCP